MNTLQEEQAGNVAEAETLFGLRVDKTILFSNHNIKEFLPK